MFRSDRLAKTTWRWLSAVCAAALVGACGQKMDNQPRYEPLEASDFFDDGLASRQLVEGTVARGQLRNDDHLYRGRAAGEFARGFPMEVDRKLLERGRERYEIFCTPCHDPLGHGQGIIVQRGFPAPPSYHIDRLRGAPEGYYFDVISNGFGKMQSYKSMVPVKDRWAIIAYIRTLQLSQHVETETLGEEDLNQLEQAP